MYSFYALFGIFSFLQNEINKVSSQSEIRYSKMILEFLDYNLRKKDSERSRAGYV